MSLGSAHLLPKVIIGGSAEEIDLKKFEDEVLQETVAVKAAAPSLSKAELEDQVLINLQAKGVSTWHLDVSHQTERIENSECYLKAETLESARMELGSRVPEGASRFTNFVSGLFSSTSAESDIYCEDEASHPSYSSPATYESQTADYYRAPISKAQISKVLARNENN